MRIEVNGVRLFVDVEGAKLVPDGPRMREKPTLILLHGGPGGDHSVYKPDFSSLSDVCQVVYYDHRGQGRSDASSPEFWNLDQWSDDLVGLCDALEIQHPIVMGGSFGGYVAIAYATRYPEHPSKLILWSTRAQAPDYERSLLVYERLGGPDARAVASRFFEDPSGANRDDFFRVCVPMYFRTEPDPDKMRRTVRKPEVAEHFRTGELLKMDYLHALASIRCPTLVIGGEEDPQIPIQDQVDIANALPPHLVQFHRVPNAGHVVFHDAPASMDLARKFILA
jgi:proline iminopeptidase